MKTRIKINWNGVKKTEAVKVKVASSEVQTAAEPEKPRLVFDENFEGDLQLQAPEPVVRHPFAGPQPVRKQPTIAELSALESAPEGMDQKDWEKKICQERLCSVFKAAMKKRWDVNVPFFTAPERVCFKNFYGYLQDLQLAEEIVQYVVENWPGIKARYRPPFEYPVPRTFAYANFSKQIAVEYHRKKNVTAEDPTYISDFKDETNAGQQYQSDW